MALSMSSLFRSPVALTRVIGPAVLSTALGLVACDGREGPGGTRGPEGSGGSSGQDGKSGSTGPRGEQGSEGPRGLRGLDGSQGPKGEKGDKGEVGFTGSKGDMGIPGAKGDPGFPGPVGPPGPMGPAGPAGLLNPSKCRFDFDIKYTSSYTIGYGDLYCKPSEFLLTGGCAIYQSGLLADKMRYVENRPTSKATGPFLVKPTSLVEGGWICQGTTDSKVDWNIYIWITCCPVP